MDLQGMLGQLGKGGPKPDFAALIAAAEKEVNKLEGSEPVSAAPPTKLVVQAPTLSAAFPMAGAAASSSSSSSSSRAAQQKQQAEEVQELDVAASMPKASAILAVAAQNKVNPAAAAAVPKGKSPAPGLPQKPALLVPTQHKGGLHGSSSSSSASKAAASALSALSNLPAGSAAQQWYAQKVATAQLNEKVMKGESLTDEEMRFLEIQMLSEALEEQRVAPEKKKGKEVVSPLAAEALAGRSDWGNVMTKANVLKSDTAAKAAGPAAAASKPAAPKPVPAFRNAFVMQGPGRQAAKTQAQLAAETANRLAAAAANSAKAQKQAAEEAKIRKLAEEMEKDGKVDTKGSDARSPRRKGAKPRRGGSRSSARSGKDGGSASRSASQDDRPRSPSPAPSSGEPVAIRIKTKPRGPDRPLSPSPGGGAAGDRRDKRGSKADEARRPAKQPAADRGLGSSRAFKEKVIEEKKLRSQRDESRPPPRRGSKRGREEEDDESCERERPRARHRDRDRDRDTATDRRGRGGGGGRSPPASDRRGGDRGQRRQREEQPRYNRAPPPGTRGGREESPDEDSREPSPPPPRRGRDSQRDGGGGGRRGGGRDRAPVLKARTPSPSEASYSGSESDKGSDSSQSSAPKKKMRPAGINWDVPDGDPLEPVAAPPKTKTKTPAKTSTSTALAISGDQLAKEQQALQEQLRKQKGDGGSTTVSLSNTLPVAMRPAGAGQVVGANQIVLGKVLPAGSGTNSKSGPGRQAATDRKHFCMKYLSGMCFDQGCSLRHPANDQELQEGRKKFDKPCIFGAKCFRVGCLYHHDFS